MSIIQWMNESLERKYFLTESKKDEEDFIAFAGENLAGRFNKLKAAQKISGKESDYGYWEKKSVYELEDFIEEKEATMSGNESRRQDKAGATRIYDGDGWKIYKITTYDAAKYYGENTKWCITGRYSGHENEGQKWFDEYKKDGVKDYYFLIPENDPNGKWCYLDYGKYPVLDAIDVFFDAEDNHYSFLSLDEIEKRVPKSILFKLPGVAEYKPYTDAGNTEVIYDANGWKVVELTTPRSRAYYFNVGLRSMWGTKISGSEHMCLIYHNGVREYSYTSGRYVDKEKLWNLQRNGSTWWATTSGIYTLTKDIPMDVLCSLPNMSTAVWDIANKNKDLDTEGILTYEKGMRFDDVLPILTKIKTLIVPSGITKIESYTFRDAKNLAVIDFSGASDLVTIGDAAFEGTAVTQLLFPKSLKTIGSKAFLDCKNLQSTSFEDGSQIQQIGMDAFIRCEELCRVDLPYTLSQIGDLAFGGEYDKKTDSFCKRSNITFYVQNRNLILSGELRKRAGLKDDDTIVLADTGEIISGLEVRTSPEWNQ